MIRSGSVRCPQRERTGIPLRCGGASCPQRGRTGSRLRCGSPCRQRRRQVVSSLQQTAGRGGGFSGGMPHGQERGEVSPELALAPVQTEGEGACAGG